MAVERLMRCENIVALSEELGVHRRLLYKWRDQLDPIDISDEPPPENPRESTLRKEVSTEDANLNVGRMLRAPSKTRESPYCPSCSL